MENVISVRGLGKCYQVNGKPHWAFRNIDIDVRRGDVLGVIGRNGAGKTTLLRVLSRITDPTEGEGRIKGRIGTLLETGTGFHPELTGRENVFMNGAILGMRPPEIRSKFDEIVEFAGIGKFIDARVKTYSSGMRSRLTFAVAAHLNTEILLVDEVLAVGDIAFQEKCLKKMDELTQHQERTILFVSHSMGAIQSLCNRAILIEDGRVFVEGSTETVIKAYNELLLGPKGPDLSKESKRKGSGILRFTGMRLETLDGAPINAVPAGTGVRIILDFESRLPTPCDDLVLTVALVGRKGRLLTMRSDVVRANLIVDGNRGHFVCTVPKLHLLPGNYSVVAGCEANRTLADELNHSFSIIVADNDYYGTGRMLQSGDFGDVLIDYSWECLSHASA